MQNFSNIEYEKMISELISDTFYVELSIRGKIKGIRQFSEVIIRKILNIGSDRKLLLGHLNSPAYNNKGKQTGGAREELNKLSPQRKEELLEIIEEIRPLGNKGSHTQHIDEFTTDELDKVVNGLFDLYAFLFIEYFLEYPMILLSPAEVMYDFSLLPPIIRRKVLEYLYNDNPNLQIANRLCLAIIKTDGKTETYNWLNKEKDKLKRIEYPNEREIREYITTIGLEVSPGNYVVSLMLPNYDNVFDLLVDKVKDNQTSINEAGKMYSNFEEAKIHYQINRHENSTEKLKKLHSLMDFVYLGRISI